MGKVNPQDGWLISCGGRAVDPRPYLNFSHRGEQLITELPPPKCRGGWEIRVGYAPRSRMKWVEEHIASSVL